jgi:hypothetical protein
MDKFLEITTDNAKAIRNIYNQKEIKNFIGKIFEDKNITEPNIKAWLNGNLRNYILKEQPLEIIESFNDVVEAWAINGIKNGTLSRVILDDDLQNKVLHAIDYLRVEFHNKDLSRLTIPDAISQSIEWVEKQKKVEDDLTGRTHYMDCGDGYHIVEIHTKQALLYEGSQMNHCIGLYHSKSVARKVNRAFSLRDADNTPHATLLFNVIENSINEVKGKSNSIVKEEYQKYLIPFFNNFEFMIMKDYDYLPNIIYNEGEFKLTNKKFNINVFKFPPLKYKSYENDLFIQDVKHDIVREKIILGSLNNASHSIADKKFSFLTIEEIHESNMDLLRKLNVKSLEVESIFRDINTIENNNAQFMSIKDNEAIKINKIKSSSVKSVFIGKSETSKKHNHLEIETIDFSQCENLDSLVIYKCKIKNLILPRNVKDINIKFSTVESINSCTIENLYLKDTTINNDELGCHKLYYFDSKLNEDKVLDNLLNVSAKFNSIRSINRVNNDEIEINNKKVIYDQLSAIYDPDYSIIIPDIYSKPSFELGNENNKYLFDATKPHYNRDLRKIVSMVDTDIKIIQVADYLDINYLTNKAIENNKIYNDVAIKQQFFNYLMMEGALGQLLLVETLRSITPNVDRQIFSALIIGKPHPIIEKLFDKIENHPYYLMNHDYNKVYEHTHKVNLELLYDKALFTFKDTEFDTVVMKDFFEKCRKKEATSEYLEIIKNTENVFNEIINISNLVVQVGDVSKLVNNKANKDIDFTDEQKKSIYIRFFDDHPEKDKSSKQILKDVYDLINNNKLYEVLDRQSLIDSFILYKHSFLPQRPKIK